MARRIRLGGKTGDAKPLGTDGKRKPFRRGERHPDTGKGSRPAARRNMGYLPRGKPGLFQRRARKFGDQRGMSVPRRVQMLAGNAVGDDGGRCLVGT